MLDKLEAAAAIEAINQGAIAHGTMKSHDRDEYLQGLKSRLGARRPRPQRASPEQLRRLGFNIVVQDA